MDNKRLQRFTIEKKDYVGGNCLLTLVTSDGASLPTIVPGQFVEVKVDASGVLLRRPISICDIILDTRLILLVKPVGKASTFMTEMPIGSQLDIMLPLGNGFDISAASGHRVLLVGGGVGVAPMVMLSRYLYEAGADVTVVIGGRSSADVEGVKSLFIKGVNTYISTDDGSVEHHGLVTQNPAFASEYDVIYTCGPTPMMKAVAKIAKQRNIDCYVSLENMMGCGIGACLCCVEKTIEGNLCVCTDGPVFKTDKLLWN